ncbi:MAG: SdrD B-like domain-containing protein, partial [Cocleimonas sp.]
SDGVRVDTDFTVVLSQVEGIVGSPAPTSELPAGCSINGEKVGLTGTDGNPDGIVAVSVAKDNVVDANFSISQMVKIGNRVWIEGDNDGDATNGTPLPVVGATVTAVCNGTSYTADTDASGNYEIEVPVNSSCTVSVSTPTNTMPTKGSDDNSAGEDNKSHDSSGTTVAVTTADNMTVDFGFQQLVKIGNRIWIEDDNDGDATTGNITVPPAGTVVTATASDGTQYTGITDLNGMYYIDVPANDTYMVSVSTGKVATKGSDDAQVPDTSAEDDKSHDGAGTEVVVGTDDNMTLDFGFTPEDLPTGSKPGFVNIGDRIWIEDDNDGDASTGNITKPEAGLVVTATSDTTGEKFTGKTDVNGNYLIEVPANDTYTVTTQAPKGTCASLTCAKEGDLEVPDLTSENDKTHDGVRGTKVTVGTEDNLSVDFGFCPVTVVTGTKGGSASYLMLSLLGLFGLRRRLAKLNSK